MDDDYRTVWQSAQKEIICFVGGGGKTTAMYEMAAFAASKGKRVLVSTTTHIFKPETQFAENAEEALALWAQGRFAVIGTVEETAGSRASSEADQVPFVIKLTAPKEHLYQELASQADLVLLEADGAKGHPCKVPADHEPVIPKECTLAVGVFGMTALGKPVEEVCFRFHQWGAWTGWEPEKKMDEKTAAELLASTLGTRKGVGDRPYLVLLNQCDNEQIVEQAETIRQLLAGEGITAKLRANPVLS